MAIKGQNLRLFVGGKVIAAATNCSVEVNANTENTSTKDDAGDWDVNEVVGKSWSFTADSLVVASDSTVTNPALSLIGTTVAIEFAQASGASNRTKGTKIVGGNAIITKVSWTAQNRQNGTVSINGLGTGSLS